MAKSACVQADFVPGRHAAGRKSVYFLAGGVFEFEGNNVGSVKVEYHAIVYFVDGNGKNGPAVDVLSQAKPLIDEHQSTASAKDGQPASGAGESPAVNRFTDVEPADESKQQGR